MKSRELEFFSKFSISFRSSDAVYLIKVKRGQMYEHTGTIITMINLKPYDNAYPTTTL